MLRVQPQSPATPLAPVIVMFDHPVAPRLDESVDPKRVLRIVPEVRARMYWRDPSSIVAEFESPWAPGSSYEVRVDPRLRSADGLRLVATPAVRIDVEMPRALGVYVSSAEADTILRPLAVYTGSFDLSALADRVWFEAWNECASAKKLPLTPVAIRPVSDADPAGVRDMSPQRDRRLDHLRRVVELRAPDIVARGCSGYLYVPEVIGKPRSMWQNLEVPPPFELHSITCSRECSRGQVVLDFTRPIDAEEVRAHVRVNGQPARYANSEASTHIVLPEVLQTKQSVRISVDAALSSRAGERLGRDTTVVISGLPLAPAVGFRSGLLMSPPDAPFLLKVRHRNTDSITVIIGRVVDSVRAAALLNSDYGDMFASLLWQSVVSDTVVHILPSFAPVDSDRVVTLPLSLIPEKWRGESLLLVRAQPTEKYKPSVMTEKMPNVVRPPVGADGLTPRFAVLQRSNLTAHAWMTDERTEVWVTTLRDAAPRSGATVRLFDDSLRVLATGVTDARGRATLRTALPKVAPWQRYHVEVAQGKDRAFFNVSLYPTQRALSEAGDSLGSEGTSVATSFGTRWLHGAAFTDRGIYRPGERVYFGGAARTYDAKEGYRVPASDSARWTVWGTNSDGAMDRIWSRTGPLSDFGTRADSFTIDRTARLGTYVTTLAIRDGRKWRTTARTEFRVAEYRAPEFAVRLDADTSTTLFGGDTAKVRVEAKYLFGVPMAGGQVQWWSTYQERELRIPALARYNVGRSRWRTGEQAPSTEPRSGTGTVADDGIAWIDIPTSALTRPGVVSVNVSVADLNRRAVSSAVTIPIHAAEAYLGMRTRERRWYWKQGDSIVAELLLVRQDGAPRVGEKVSVVAERTRWVDGKSKRDTVWSTTVTSAATPTTITFTPREGGSYELVGEARDERGRRAITGLDVWVWGGTPWWNQASTASRDLTMRADRTSYAPGDTVSLFVESPMEQQAWLTVGHEGMLGEQFVALHAGINDVRVPIPANVGRVATIRMIGIRPYGPATGSDSGGVYYRSAGVTIQVDTNSRTLRVAVAPDRQRYAPGDSVRLELDVRDAIGKGRRSELTVWAVDEGVIALTAFVRPAMLALLLAGAGENPTNGSTLLASMLTSAPAVGRTYLSTPRTYYDVAASVGGIRLRGMSSLGSVVTTGLATGEGDAPFRTRFATTPFFTGRVRTDSLGRATTSFQLPDNISAFRIFAVAMGEDVSTGGADTSIISTSDLVVRPALPRIVRAGDELFAGAVLTKESAGHAPVSLSVQATNARVIGDATQRDTLDGKRPRELRFPLQITGGDTASFIFRGATLSGAPMNDAVEARLAVSPPGRARAHVVTGMLERGGAATLAMPAGTDTVRSYVSLQLGVSPLPLVRQFSEALRIYPYFCTEQVSSAGRALLARLKLERVVDAGATLTARDRTQLETGAVMLLGRQRDDGGFGYWSSTNWTTPWLTTYALEFLIGARDEGIAVPENALRRARAFLVNIAAEQRVARMSPAQSRRDSLAWPHDALATAKLLRRLGAPDLALEKIVWTMRDSLGFEDRLSLAAISAAQADTARALALLDAAWSSARIEGRRVVLDDSVASFSWLFQSKLRPAALLLATTARLQPRHPRIGALFESIVQMGRSGSARWWNTLDQAAIAEALTAAATTMGLTTERDVAIAGPRGRIANVTLARGRVDSVRMAISSLSVPVRDSSELRLSLSSSSTAPTYYAMTAFEIPTARPVRADDAGIGVERWYESYESGKPITEVREGELVRVRLRIIAPDDREFVVIDDALPAGLEAVDLSLRTSASLPPFEGAPRLSKDMNDGPTALRWAYGGWDSGWWTPWEHKEIRDDRVLYFARQLWKGSYQASYVARATTAGTFVRPPAQAEEMYNPAVRGRSDGGTFTVTRAPK